MNQIASTQCDQSLRKTIKLLEGKGITRPRDYLLKHPLPSSSKESIHEELVGQVKHKVAEALACPLTAGDVALEEENERHVFLSTGCPGMDELLGGGCLIGEMTEFAGAPATGKTQLAFFTALTTAAADPNATILYIDASNSFSASRMSQLFTFSDRFDFLRTKGMNAEYVLSRIKCIQCPDACKLLDILEELDTKLAEKSDPFVSQLNLVIIDSVGALFSPMVGFGQTRGYVVMMTVGHMLKTMAMRYRFAAMTLNYGVQSDFRGGKGSRNAVSGPVSDIGGQLRTKPALGTTWSFVPNIRLFFSVINDSENAGDNEVLSYQNRQGLITALTKRRVVVYNSHRTVTYRKPGTQRIIRSF
ncbi:P-loop containing nucleoside triphosphate hydrolase protein [Powellomyces hirtus]|nr:P-loop containing nucleoside triphosphate hydrolase protein [Powellomyces hirtus]